MELNKPKGEPAQLTWDRFYGCLGSPNLSMHSKSGPLIVSTYSIEDDHGWMVKLGPGGPVEFILITLMLTIDQFSQQLERRAHKNWAQMIIWSRFWLKHWGVNGLSISSKLKGPNPKNALREDPFVSPIDNQSRSRWLH